MAIPVIFDIVNQILVGIFTVYTANILGKFADAVFSFNMSYGLKNIWKLLFCIGVTVFILPLIELIGNIFMFKYALMHDRMVLGRFLDKEYEKVMAIEAGEAQYRLNNDPCEMRIVWAVMMPKFIVVPLTLAYLLFNTLQISLLFTLLTFAVSLIKLVVPVAVKKLQAKYDRQTREYNTKVREYETEITMKPYVVRMYGLKNAFIEKIDGLYHEYFKNVQTKDITCKTVADKLTSFLDTFCILIILLAGAALVAAGAVRIGAVAAMVGYFGVFNMILDDVSYIIKNIPILRNLSDRIAVLYSDKEDLSGEEIKDVTNISAKGLSFAYDEKQVFDHLDFHIGLGDKTAVTGANWAGKSTLIQIMCGLLKGYKGSLKLNNKELRSVAIESWRSQFAYAEQEPYLFEGSVRDNVRLGNLSAADADIDAIMEKAGVSYLSQRIVSMAQNDLPGGEKQKISIARALLKNTPILILDEPSNNLDADSFLWLQEFIKTSAKTIIFISHNPELTGVSNRLINL